MSDATESALFIDRDGVLNARLPGRYVTDWSAWTWLPGARTALVALRQEFDRLIVITNQQGIGKGLMTVADLAEVHTQMQTALETTGGAVDAIYHCPHLAQANCPCRKPAPGMIEQALRDFPAIDLTKSALVGDSYTDLQLGTSLGLTTYWVDTKVEDRKQIQTAIAQQVLVVAGRYAGLDDLAEQLG